MKMLLLSLLSTLIAAASAVEHDDGLVLRQLHVVTRHGSRYALPKSADGLKYMDSNAQLTAFGRKQMYDLGVWLHHTYYSKSENAQLAFESSPYDRTIGSANALALGLMNITSASIHSSTSSKTNAPMEVLTGLPPVFMSDDDNDIYIRAYDKCPAFGLKLLSLYSSDQWKKLEDDSMPLLQKLASIEEFQQYHLEYIEGDASSQFIPLTQIYNVFDTVHVAKTECAASLALGPEFFTNELVPLQSAAGASTRSCTEAIEDWISTEDWKELEQLAHTVELLKYNGGPHQTDPAANTDAGKLVGANLLGRILQRIMHNDSDDKIPSATTLMAPDLYVYSAHYPTVLGLFAALQEPFFVDTNLADGTNLKSDQLIIPNYGSALLFEYFEDTKATSEHTKMLLRVRYKNDGNVTAIATTPTSDGKTTHTSSTPVLVPLKTVCLQKQPSSDITHTSTEYCPIQQLSSALFEVLNDVGDGSGDSGTDPFPDWSDMHKTWCKACGNEKAAPCLKQILHEAKKAADADSSSSSSGGFWGAFTGHHDSGAASSSETTCGDGDDGYERPMLSGILIGLALSVGLVALVWAVLWFSQLRDTTQMNKSNVESIVKQAESATTTTSSSGRSVGNISTIMQETVGDDTIMEEDESANADDEEEPKEVVKAETADLA